MTDYPEDKWEECVGCKFNSCKKKSNLSESDYRVFSCEADVNDFPCPRIPDLYPHKLADIKNKDDESIFENKNALDPDLPVYEVYFVEIHDGIEQNLRPFVALSDDVEHLRKEINRKLQKRVYRHLRLFNIKKLSEIFPNYNIMALPRNINHIVYPKVDVEMDHGLSRIKMKEMVLDLEKFPFFKGKEEPLSNLSINMDLSDYEETGRTDLPKDIRKKRVKSETSRNRRRRKA